ncbi:YlmH family RNA-binding protein [Fructilactobacillus fructivorans]|uniref:S4-like RNA-binding domain protein n=1 Tax=Fructilactobacillus fructivorans TaxID=1614 RepID=A0A0C1Q085_9LACO|nr:YlmH/Sll1252 family protein [Fructilactobacillus fructivorans]KID41298.1 S4-like RNA-binding domain protein [Fructilactobacillus fructivorans]MCT0152099.1 RNA-binding protein [Fructilactobacillus fructivorans]MCT2867818.1 RNA-binding protein [Fructilactobacillus fructivorans]MCT2868378.1 RNA-binding protein [Fructilactobacillus fructivorans]MCT2873859.1 RNA-binding protein [Fructilactobacillus fructivorans]
MSIEKDIEQHFRKSEIPFLQTASDWIESANSEYRPILTSFLNSRECYLLQTLVNRYPHLQLSTFGGYKDAEMKRGIIYPDYFHPEVKDYRLALVEIEYPEKFASIHHNQVLGSLMGSGIERKVLGDILTDGERFQFICEQEMVGYLTQEVDRIGRVKVNLKEVNLSEMIQGENDWVTSFVTLPSFRLDVVISIGFRISRSVAKSLVEHEKVRLNWFEFTKPNYEIKVSDMISVRGYGRIRVVGYNGHSKKGKLKAELNIIKNK